MSVATVQENRHDTLDLIVEPSKPLVLVKFNEVYDFTITRDYEEACVEDAKFELDRKISKIVPEASTSTENVLDLHNRRGRRFTFVVHKERWFKTQAAKVHHVMTEQGKVRRAADNRFKQRNRQHPHHGAA